LNSKKNILIIGGTGFIGYHLAKRSLQIGLKVTSVSSKRPKKLRHLPKVKYIICDTTKKKLIKKKIKKYFHYVVNLSGYVNHTNKKKTFNSHYNGCKNIVNFFLEKPPISFVQMGSSGEYGRLNSPQKENFICKPKSIYGQAKLLSSKYLLNLFKKKKFPCTILRLYQAYGPKQDFNRFIPIIIKACMENKEFLCSDGKQYRDFIHIDDVVEAIIKTLKAKKARGQIINIGCGKPKKIKNIIDFVKKELGGGYPQFGKIKLRKDEILKIYPNIKKAQKLINWKPKILFDTGLKSTIKFYNEQKT
jgi:nucleoside-diphosphate-sugar epimerase|tara:strand:+ start:493 stop:1404 length:912 start_codon:yes stop_codon:yes gene_type:complete